MPLNADSIKEKLVALGVPEGSALAVAISGGADSTALLLLAAVSFNVTAITVDHGLRPEAKSEAEQVAKLCSDRGIPHVLLTWDGDKPSTNIQAAARNARYDLISQWCRNNNIRYVATAHHMDDQAETVLLRLARGSGVYGLAAMTPTRVFDGITLVRPLLDRRKQELIECLQAENVSWVEDPSNQAARFDRVKIRKLLEEPPLEGLHAERLAGTAERLRRTRQALEHYEAVWLGRAAEFFPEGYAILDRSELKSEPEEIVLRGVASLCRFSGKGDYVPRMEKLLRLFENMSGPDFTGQTLYGAQFSPIDAKKVLVSRELRDCADVTSLKETVTWDNRFEIVAKGDIAGHEIRALGDEGWGQLRSTGFDLFKANIPRLVALALPAIFKGRDLQAVPHIGYTVAKGLSLEARLKRTLRTKK